MSERKLVVVDVETTGLEPHDICVEVGWHDVQSGEHGSFVPAHDVAWVLANAHPRALEVNGYRDRLVDAAQDDGTEVRRLHERLAGQVIGGSNVRTDAAHLARLFDPTGLEREPFYYHLVELSSVTAGALRLPLTDPPGLRGCCNLLGVDPEDEVHSAEGGAAATARCFRALQALAAGTEWGAEWADGGYCPAKPPRNEEFARTHARHWGTRVIRRHVGPWVLDESGEPTNLDGWS